MNRLLQWVLAATLVCGASVFTACSDKEDNPVQPQQRERVITFEGVQFFAYE